MSCQTSFADLDYHHKKRLTRREVFLNEMEQTVPWLKLIAWIEPAYPRSGRRGRQPMPLASMLRIHCLQNRFSFSDRQMEDALYEIESVRRFAGCGSVTEALPDAATILNFRHWVEKQRLTEKLLETINAYFKEQELLVSQGTMVDATIIHAPSSTKNQEQARDPDMHQTRKGQQCYFSMKIHIGADVNSGAVHTVTTTDANVADITELPKLLRADDRGIFAGRLYQRRIQTRRPASKPALVRQ